MSRRSTLQIAPRPTGRGTVSTAEPTTPTIRPGSSASSLSAGVLGTAGFNPTQWHAFQRATQPGYFGWLDHVRAAAACTRPIRLSGWVETTHPGTGHRLVHSDTAGMPDGVIYKACGNRRARVCPACARTYQRDAYQLLRAGLVGGKGVPDTVSQHPAVFVTLTAPSFGLIHARVIKNHTCRDRRRCDCRPEPCRARTHGETGLCEHGNPTVCFARHEADDKRVGRPMCLDCYDHDHQAVWNLFCSGELWRRTKQAAERYLAQLAKQRGIPPVYVPGPGGKARPKPPVRIAHGKAAEFQARGAIHFHALLRLDGVDPADPDAVIPPSAGFNSVDLDEAITYAAEHTAYTSPPHPDRPDGWPIVWGDEGQGRYAYVRHITLTGRGEVTDQMVAGYLAKYATKSTEVTGHQSTRITAQDIDQHADPDGEHTARLIDACWRLGRPTHTPVPLSQRPAKPHPATRLGPSWTCRTCGTHTRLRVCPQCTVPAQGAVDTEAPNPTRRGTYQGVRRWAHMLGFGGHFLTKARRYSLTFRDLRAARITYRRTQDPGPTYAPIRTADHTEETTLVVGVLTYAGSGWRTTGDALLANTAADQARKRTEAGREELAHEIGSLLVAVRPAA